MGMTTWDMGRCSPKSVTRKWVTQSDRRVITVADDTTGMGTGSTQRGTAVSSSAAFSPIITDGALVLPVVTLGMIEASAIRSPSIP